MRTSLSSIQFLHRIGKIISRLSFIVSSLAFLFCSVTAICAGCGVESISAKLESLPVFSSGPGYIYHIFISVAVMTLGEAVISQQAVDYFKKELETGTPFDKENSERLKKLGIITIVVPFVTFVISKVIYAVLVKKFGTFDYSLDYAGGSIAVGIMFIILSLICRYGAEIDRDGKNKES